MRRRATLPHPSECSTIAAPGLSFRVRNGTGRLTWAMTAAKPQPTKPRPKRGSGHGTRKRSGNRTTDANKQRFTTSFRDHRTMLNAIKTTTQQKIRPLPHKGRMMMSPSPVSTGRLHPSQGFHLRPIKHVFSMRATGTEVPRNPNLGAGFPLRCFQRLSLPNVANRPCRWRDNRHTRGSSTQVLSYYGQASSGFQRAQRIETKLSHDVLNPARVPL